MKIGYVRCSSKDQNPERQEVLMERLGVEKVFIDVCSGKDTNRPQLKEMLDFMREGDMIVVESFSRLARNTKDLLDITDTMTKKGVEFVSQKEAIDTKTPVGKALLTILGAIRELEREYILARQKEGIELKKARGEYKGRVPIAIDKKQFEQEYRLWKSGQITARTAMAHLGLKPNTFYRRVKEYEGCGG
ncbi:MAG TPA: recombinase family protein [Clostridia bacterium]|nr:recombinase family protein [Clostridia bacterium]